MKGIYLTFCSWILLVFASCSIFSDHCFNLNNQSIRFSKGYRPVEDGRFKTEGYYKLDHQSSKYNFILYPDGTYIWFWFKDRCMENVGKSVANLDSLIDNRFMTGGIYKITGDSIMVDSYNYNYWLGCAEDLYKSLYIIVDSVTLLDPEWGYYYRFVPAEGLPSPMEVRVKERKFMWYDEEEWQLYRQQLKEYLDRKAADAALKSGTPNR